MTSFFLVLLSFFLPTQLGYHFDSLATYVYGFRIDYLIPTLYLTDIFAIALIVLNFKKKYWFFILISLALFLLTKTFKYFKLLEILLLIDVVRSYEKLNFLKQVYIPLSFSVIIICLLGIIQTFLGHSVGGPFYFLGERTFDINTFGISTFTLNGVEYLRSYSTFSHPNSLAGFLFVFLIFTLFYKNKLKKSYFLLLISLTLITLLTSYSLNVLVSGVLLATLYLIKAGKNLILSILLATTVLTFLVPKTAFREVDYRVDLAKSSIILFLDRPVFGIGLNKFIPALANTSPIFKNSWDLQPVHNIYLLILSELGLVGLALVLYFLFSVPLTIFVTPILLTGLFDHYWLTLQQNILLFSLVIGASFAKLKEWKKA